jgi:hypothetical protein
MIRQMGERWRKNLIMARATPRDHRINRTVKLDQDDVESRGEYDTG